MDMRIRSYETLLGKISQLYSCQDYQVRETREAWMSFQRHRPVVVPGTGARSWPNSRPAGLSTLEMGVNNRRAVSTSESMRLRNLPPIKDHTRPGNRKVGTRTDTSVKEQPSWAKSWARRRAEQTNVHSKGCAANKGRNPILSPLTSTSLKSARQKTEVVAMNEKEAMLFKRLKGIYANSTDRAMRAQRLQNSISSLQTRTLHSELDCSLREYKRKQEEDVRNRSELKRLRDRFTKDRERRHRRSYVSINALECPRVSRHAYGLPEDGEEDTQSGVTHHAEQKLRDIWKNAMKRAALVDKMINVRTKNETKLPEIKVRRQSVSHKDPRTPSAEKNRREGLRRDSIETVNQLQMVLGEIDVMSTVVSDSDEDLEDTEQDLDL